MVDNILWKVIKIFLAVSLVNKLSSITHKTIAPKNFSTLFRGRFFVCSSFSLFSFTIRVMFTFLLFCVCDVNF